MFFFKDRVLYKSGEGHPGPSRRPPRACWPSPALPPSAWTSPSSLPGPATPHGRAVAPGSALRPRLHVQRPAISAGPRDPATGPSTGGLGGQGGFRQSDFETMVLRALWSDCGRHFSTSQRAESCPSARDWSGGRLDSAGRPSGPPLVAFPTFVQEIQDSDLFEKRHDYISNAMAIFCRKS